MRLFTIFFVSCLVTLTSICPVRSQQEGSAPQFSPYFRVYTGEGKPVAMADISQAMAGVDVVFVGETHNDPMAHSLELAILKRAHEAASAGPSEAGGRNALLSMEMFERDIQPVLDEYLAGIISERHFLESSRPWTNYKGDYRPLVEFAREQKLTVLAANAPKRYANLVSRQGRNALSTALPRAAQWLPPVPYGFPSPAYKAKFEALFAQPGKPLPPSLSSKGFFQHGMGNLQYTLDAQSLWDATMAFSMAEELLRHPNALIVHVVGKFHCEGRLGIPDHLLRYRPGTKFVVVTVEPADDITAFTENHKGLGDFVILTDSKLPRSYEDK